MRPELIAAGTKVGVDVSEMTTKEARNTIRLADQQIKARRAGDLLREAAAAGFVPGRKIRKKADGKTGEITTVSANHVQGIVDVRLKNKSGSYTLTNWLGELQWDLLAE